MVATSLPPAKAICSDRLPFLNLCKNLKNTGGTDWGGLPQWFRFIQDLESSSLRSPVIEVLIPQTNKMTVPSVWHLSLLATALCMALEVSVLSFFCISKCLEGK